MNLNKIILDKINKFVIVSKEFDTNYKNIINNDSMIIDENIIKIIYTLTTNYIELRKIHGNLLLLLDEYKGINNIEQDNKLYDLSTFSSILANISELITNIDFQYKKIAIKFPKLINKKPLLVLLLTDGENNLITELFNKIKEEVPENIYKIILCSKTDDKIKCNEIIGMNLTLKITSLPMLYIINNTNITEIPIDKITDIVTLKSLLI